MKIYLAARYSAQQEMRGIRDVLTALGHEVTSSWIDQNDHGIDGLTPDVMNADPDLCAPFAASDITDLLRADTFVSFTEFGPSTTGGRHVEHGIALGTGKRVIVVGPRENIFQTVPPVEHYPDWRHLALTFSSEFYARNPQAVAR